MKGEVELASVPKIILKGYRMAAVRPGIFKGHWGGGRIFQEYKGGRWTACTKLWY